MKRLVICGGCSKSGKTTVLTLLERQYSLPYYKKFELVKEVAKCRNLPFGDIPSCYDDLERNAINKLAIEADATKYSLLDLHYAIQPLHDTSYALGISTNEDIQEPYVSGMSYEHIEQLASQFVLTLFYFTTDPSIILERRRYFQSLGIPQRSLSLRSIKREQENEFAQFQNFLRIAVKNGHGTSSNVFNTKENLEETVYRVASCLCL